MRILLQRFDAETGDEEEKSEESEATTSFLTQLATWHKQELDEKLASRVQVSQRAVAKIIQVCITLLRISKLLHTLCAKLTNFDIAAFGLQVGTSNGQI